MANEHDPCDARSFEKLRRILPAMSRERRGGTSLARPLPDEVAFKLTNRCNLRCTHCYQWNEKGHHWTLGPSEREADLPFEIVKQVLAVTRTVRSNIYLWGGEPLLYRAWDDLVALLVRDPRWVTLCTNGLEIERRLESILEISERLEVYAAIDGPSDAHDAVRGPRAFERTMRGMDLLVDQRRAGRFRGELSINCVTTDQNVDWLPDFVRSCDARGFDTIYISLPWYLSDDTSREMDAYCREHRPWDLEDRQGTRSWWSYKYRIDPARIEPLARALATLRRSVNRIKLRWNPAVEPGDLEEFLSGSSKPAGGKSKCLSIGNRMDVLPDGKVVSCKFFPESEVGDLARQGLEEVWHGERFETMRRTVARHGLLPVCAKCNLLYSRGT